MLGFRRKLVSTGVRCRGMSTMDLPPVVSSIIHSTSHPHAQIAVLSLCRPKAHNALSMALMETLHTHLLSIAKDERIRGVLLKSTHPTTFCAGADLVERRGMSAAQVSQFLTDMRTAFTLLAELPVPTVSVVAGNALGGGCELALCTDFRMLGPRCVMGLPETGLGIMPGAGGTVRMTRLIGASKTKELVFSARRVAVHEAAALGIGVAQDDPEGAALALLEGFIRNSPTGIRMAKRSIDFAAQGDVGVEAGLDMERASYNICLEGPDRDEGLLAFKEKRKPVFRGTKFGRGESKM